MEQPDLNSRSLQRGTKLGPYTIVELIGAGGMGSVWKAEDTRLNRLVAIKTCDQRFSERFEREARAIAALNHPHICSLYDVAPEYLVMEYVEGEPLQGPLPLDRALAIADQMLDALDAAHRKGIVHRDLKPANILLTRHGVKVLDFGLAKMSRARVAGRDTQTALESSSLTAEGSILGTVFYMSPEQIEGQEADARSDIFSFGVVLYELISGKRPFSGKSQASLIASILREQPQRLRELQPLTPADVDGVVQTCLEKDPEKRWQSAREVKHALGWISAQGPSARTVAKPPRFWQGLAAALALVALGILAWMSWPKAPDPSSRFELVLPENVTPGNSLAVSPDGRSIVLETGQSGLWIRSFDALEWRQLPGTEGAVGPFWSPDSRSLAFAVANQLRRLDVAGGPPETLSTLSTEVRGSGTWSRDGVILVGSWGGGAGGPIWRVSASGGTASAVTQVDTSTGEFYHTWPTFLPDGRHFLYFRSGPPETQGIYTGSLDAQPGEQSRARVLASPFPAAYANGYLLFLRQTTLLAQAFDAGRLEVVEAPVVVAEGVGTTWFGTGLFSVSPHGALAYRSAAKAEGTQLTWVDRRGNTVGTIGPPGTDGVVSLSPDGSRAVVKDTGYGLVGDLWTFDFSSERRARLTFRREAYARGIWSPDGARIAYPAGNLGDTLYEKSSSGVGDEKELLKETGLRHQPTSWSADGRFLLYEVENAPGTGYDVWVLPLEGDREPVRLLGETYNEWAAVFSPDMRWIAYASLEAGGNVAHVYVRPFRVSETGTPSLGESKWQVSKDFGNYPIWRDPQEIVLRTIPLGVAFYAVSVKTSATTFESGDPERLFALPHSWLDMTSDGQRFLVTVPIAQSSAPPPITMVLNWPTLVRK